MNILIRNFVNISDISEHLYCPQCHEVFKDPQVLDCGHTFCLKCLDKLAKCLECGQKINIKLVSKDLIATKIINDLDVYCINYPNCRWQNRLENLDQHFKLCKLIKSQLPDWMNDDDDDHNVNDDNTNIKQNSSQKVQNEF